MVAIVAFWSFYNIDLGARVYIVELVLFFYLLLSIKNLSRLLDPFPRRVLTLGLLWLISQMVTDIFRGTELNNLLRGWASIAFFLVDFSALYMLTIRNEKNIYHALIGSSLGLIAAASFVPTDYAQVEPWKFGFGLPVTLLVLYYLAYRKINAVKILFCLVLLGSVSIYLNARSLGGLTLLSAILIYLTRLSGESAISRIVWSPYKIAFVLSVLPLSIFTILFGYQWAAEYGYLPEKVLEKYNSGSASDIGILGLILGGRYEILISTAAIQDSPLIGHGSWATNRYYSDMIYEVSSRLKLNIDDAYLDYVVASSALIPAHSVIMQSWIWAGFCGAVFWLYVGQWTLRNTLAAVISSLPMRPLVIFLGLYAIWNLIFSPFGSDQRMYWALTIIVIHVSTRHISNKVWAK